MKRIIKPTISAMEIILLLFPCVLIFNESNTIIPNLIGILYFILLTSLCKFTKIGKWIHKRNNDINKFLNKIL